MEPVDRGHDHTPNTEDPNVSITVLDREEIAEIMQTLMPTLSEIARDSLGQEDEHLPITFENIDNLLLLMTPEGIKGFAAYQVHEIENVGRVLDEVAKMITKDNQRKGYGARLTSTAVARNSGAKYFSFATQNPAEVVSVMDGLDAEFVAPIDKFYTDDNRLFFDYIRTLEALNFRGMDPDSGVSRDYAYQGRIGDYEIDMTNPRIAAVENRFKEFGLNRDQGDGVFIMAKLRQPEVQS